MVSTVFFMIPPQIAKYRASQYKCLLKQELEAAYIFSRYVAALRARVKELRKTLGSVGQASHEDKNVASTASPTLSSLIDTAESSTELVEPRNIVATDVLAQTTASSVLAMAGVYGIQLREPEISSSLQDVNLKITLEDKFDRKFVEHSTIRHLVEDYFLPIINAQCFIIDPSQLLLDTHIRRLQVSRRLFVCMAAAIAAAHQGRYHPEMHAVARFMRQWASELTDAIFLHQTGDTVQALLLLITYELVDPSSKLVWYFLSLACRMCVRLNWHRTLFVEEPAWVAAGHGNKTEYSYSNIRRLFYMLYQWQRTISSMLGRPPLLPAQLVEPLPTLIGRLPLDPSFQAAYLESKLAQLLQRSNANNSCVVTPRLLTFISLNLHEIPTHNKLWLMLHEIVRHRCQECINLEGWSSNTAVIIEAAAKSIIETEYENHRQTKTLSIWLIAPLVFAAGNVLVEGSLYTKSETQDHAIPLRSLLKCSNLLTAYAESYPKAKIYREIFDTFMDHFV